MKKSVKKEKLDLDLVPYLVDTGMGQYCLQHQFIWTMIPGSPFVKSESNQQLNECYRNIEKDYLKYLEQKDWENGFSLISLPIRTHWFIDNFQQIYDEIGEDRYYTLLGEVLVNVEYHNYTKVFYSHLLYIGKNPLKMMNKTERKLYDKLPDRFMIYRGISSKKKITSRNFKKFVGNSWTVDKERSIWFSTQWILGINEYPVVLSTEVSKNQVLSYFTRREEEEIFIDFEKLDYSKIEIEELKPTSGFLSISPG